MSDQTWDGDWGLVIEASLTDPVLHAAVTLVHTGKLNRHQALCRAAVMLARTNADLLKRSADLMARACPDLTCHIGERR